MNGIADLNIIQLTLAYVFIAVILLIVKTRNINREKDILISTFRMTIQLFLMGTLLGYLLDRPNPWMTIAVLIVMEIFAVRNVIKLERSFMNTSIKISIMISAVSGTVFSIAYFIVFVMQIQPWYDPRYFIPISGMLIGNSMAGISLGVSKLIDNMVNKRDRVEAALMLGADIKDASKDVINDAFDTAILPTINSMLGTGIVFLPGMMTGQILSGVYPLTAIKYQLAILLGIAGSVALTTILFVNLGYKAFFNERKQLIDISNKLD